MRKLIEVIRRIRGRIELLADNLSWAQFGSNSRIIKPMRIIGKKRIFIGNDVIVLNAARIETVRTWENNEYNGEVHIGDGTSIEQCCHIISAKEVLIGKDCVISAFVYISDCAHQYTRNSGIMKTPLDVKPVKIGEHCFVGIGSCIMPGVTIGNNVVVGANSVVTNDAPDNTMIAGSPARVIKVYNQEEDCWERI